MCAGPGELERSWPFILEPAVHKKALLHKKPDLGLAEGFPKGECAQAERKHDVEEDQIRAG